MVTNYYLRKDYCSLCGRYNEVFIGSNSLGYKFMFRVTDEISSVEDWFREIDKSGGFVIDEYDRLISIDKFKEIIYSGIAGRDRKYSGHDCGNMCWTDGKYDYCSFDFG